MLLKSRHRPAPLTDHTLPLPFIIYVAGTSLRLRPPPGAPFVGYRWCSQPCQAIASGCLMTGSMDNHVSSRAACRDAPPIWLAAVGLKAHPWSVLACPGAGGTSGGEAGGCCRFHTGIAGRGRLLAASRSWLPASHCLAAKCTECILYASLRAGCRPSIAPIGYNTPDVFLNQPRTPKSSSGNWLAPVNRWPMAGHVCAHRFSRCQEEESGGPRRGRRFVWSSF